MESNGSALETGQVAEHPVDLDPVYDGMYTGPSYDYCRTIDDVPKLWRRWPVDLVVVPNEARIEGQRTRVAGFRGKTSRR